VLPAKGNVFQGDDLETLRAFLKLRPGEPIDPLFRDMEAPAHPSTLGIRSWRVVDDRVLLDDEQPHDLQREDAEYERLMAAHEAASDREQAAFDEWLSLTTAARNQGVGPEEDTVWKQLTADFEAVRAAERALWAELEAIWDRQHLRAAVHDYLQARHLLFWVRLWGGVARRVGASGHARDALATQERPASVSAAGFSATVRRAERGRGYVATVEALPGLAGEGRTAALALRRLEAAVPGYLAALRATGQPVPDPGAPREEAAGAR
jgi:predicted RNase H-like HicB family nuclease